MTQQSSGKAVNGLPSLYDEAADADTPDKSLSILSAVTGKEVARPAGHHKKPALRRVVSLFSLLIVGILGFTYWQNNGSEFEAKRTTSVSPSPTNLNVQRAKLAITLPAVARPEATAKATVHNDVAVIETVKGKPVLVPPGNASQQSDLKTLKAANTLPAQRRASNVATPPALSSTPASPMKEKNAVKKIAEQNGNSQVSKIRTPQALPAKPQPNQRNTVSVARADPDEKLLEGMLRLMRRDAPKDATHGRSAK